MVRKLTRQNLLDITDGAVFLASGGGGPASIKAAMVDMLVKHGPVELASLDEVADDDMVAVVAGAGSPATLAKQGAGLTQLVEAAIKALKSLEKAIGVSIKYIVAIETGSGNTLLPMAAALSHGAKVIDGSGARRSVPAITMCTFGELPVAPIQLVDEHGGVIGLEIPKPADAEDPFMTLLGLPQFGDLAGIAMWPMKGSVAKAHTSKDTVSFAQHLGEQIREAQTKGHDPVQAATDCVKGYKLFEGTLKEPPKTQKSGSFDFITVTLQNKAGAELRLIGQNETLIAWKSDRPHPVAMGPDLISYITSDGRPFSNADFDALSTGTQIAVIGSPSPADLRTPQIEALFLTNLRNLGYGGPYVRIEELRSINVVQHSTAHPKAVGSPRPWTGW